MHHLAAITIMATAAPVAMGSASIHVGSMYEYIEATTPLLDKDVRNTGDGTAYVRVDVVELDRAGIPLTTPLAAGDGLLASPSRLIIPADGSQRLRLVAMGSRKHERYFRVRIVPVAPTREHGFELDDEVAAAPSSPRTAVEVLVGYGVLVTSAPADAHFDTRIHHESGSLHVANEGNSTIYLRDHRTCRQDNGTCGPRQDRIVPPGQHIAVRGDDGVFHRFDVQEAAKRRRVEEGRR